MRTPHEREEARAATDKIHSRLLREGEFEQAARIAKCGKPITLRCQSCQSPRQAFTRCDVKWCPSCQHALTARTTARYQAIAAECSWPLFVTFTCRHDDNDDWNLVRQVRRAFTKLRRLRWFKRAVHGGVAGFELQNDNGELHPHVHALLDCRWFAITITEPKRRDSKDKWKRAARIACNEIGDVWSLALNRKGSVKVRRVWRRDNGDITGALAEVIKYSADGAKLAAMPGKIGPAIHALNRTRMLVSWGTFYRHPSMKRTRNAPAMCQCGCSDWLPEDLMIRTARDEYGLTRQQKRRR